MVTEVVVHTAHKIVIWSPFGVIQLHKVSLDTARFTMCLNDSYRR